MDELSSALSNDSEWFWYKTNVLTAQFFASKANLCLEHLDKQYRDLLVTSHTQEYIDRYEQYRNLTYSDFLNVRQNANHTHRWETANISEISAKINCDINRMFCAGTLGTLVDKLLSFIKSNVSGFESIRLGTDKGRKSISRLLYNIFATNKDTYEICDKCVFFSLEKIELQNDTLSQSRYVVLYFLSQLRTVQYTHTQLTSCYHNSVHIAVLQENIVALSTLTFRGDEYWQESGSGILPVELAYYNVVATQTYESIFVFLACCARMNITSITFLDAVLKRDNTFEVPHWERICTICEMLIYMIVNKAIVENAEIQERGAKHFGVVQADWTQLWCSRVHYIHEPIAVDICTEFLEAIQTNTSIDCDFLQHAMKLERDKLRCVLLKKIETNLSLSTALDKFKSESLFKCSSHEPRTFCNTTDREIRLSDDLYFSRLRSLKGIFASDLLLNCNYMCSITTPLAFSFPAEILLHYFLLWPERKIKDMVNLLIVTDESVRCLSGNQVTHKSRFSITAAEKRNEYYDDLCKQFPQEY